MRDTFLCDTIPVSLKENEETKNAMENGEKILVVEDDGFLGDLLTEHLKKNGIDVKLSRDAETAYTIIKEEPLKLVFLDLLLPGMSGLDLLRKLREEGIIPALPIIVLSNLTQPKTIEQVMELGARNFLGKSNFDLDEITEKAKTLIAQEKK